ncbi:hypothetical protein SPRG_08412 [Saprolegnia parasitica CBS 223.65]|uniref:Uncharacterized protein n=1 Tax=Saprolegnia parasitica (strain CBS 223.65) TaxID=695850 RepID=A0A067C6D6_SAPPC|nr:hypothetical protein SPRG_08412 [Saprolegnia parasitica CBS 223.65]KDO26339.1 hypothetical protein SPRG_08412 [Saprolegnia parasitica CBS 223.65]|eukprot:XP_012203038.1 hypothetical protein SPRG_08412 [Saprolegnia parasitica CBS 223.65]
MQNEKRWSPDTNILLRRNPQPPQPSSTMASQRPTTTMTTTTTMSKKVHFADCAQAYEFALGHGGSAVPLEQGPAVGLVGAPVRIGVTALRRSECRRRLRKFDKDERVAILRAAGHEMKDIVAFCVEALDIRISRGANKRTCAKKKRSSEVARNTEINENANIEFTLEAY